MSESYRLVRLAVLLAFILLGLFLAIDLLKYEQELEIRLRETPSATVVHTYDNSTAGWTIGISEPAGKKK